MAKTQVVAAIIRKGPKFLVGKRSLSKKSAPGSWSPISGQIEQGESEAAAVVRECFEEVGLIVRTVQKVAEFEIDQGKAQLHWWIVDILDRQEFLKNDEHSEIGWFTVEEMRQIPGFFQEDIEVFSRVLREY